MKFLVDELPYYGGFCPFYMMCIDSESESRCPRYWDKDTVCSYDNPCECKFLVEED